MKKRRLRAALAAVMAAVLVTGCGSAGQTTSAEKAKEYTIPELEDMKVASAPVGKPVKLTFGHGQADAHPYQQAALYFQEYVEKASGGAIQVAVYPNGTLGDERESVEELQLGATDITVAVASALSGFDQDMDVFNLPYLFESREEAFKVLDGDAGQKIFAGLEDQGIMAFGTYDLGFRSMTNSKRPINTVADAKGLRVRTLESSVCVDSLNALGMDAISMSFSELFTALQTGAVDGQENPLFTIYNSRFYEVQKYLSLTEHFYPVCPVLMSKITWEKLDPAQQKIVEEGLRESVDYERKLAGEQLDSILQGCKDKGMIVNTVDKAPFIEAEKPVYEKYREKFGPLMDAIDAAKKS